MSSIEQVSEERASVRNDLSAIFVSLELSLTTWLITSLSSGGGDKMSRHQVRGGDVAGLFARFSQLHVRRSWGEADCRRGGSAASPGACTDPRLEAANSGSRPREPWRGCFPAVGSAPPSTGRTGSMRPTRGSRAGDPS